MRLLFLYDCLYPHSLGGVEHRNRALGDALAQRGHDVTLAAFCEPAAGPAPGSVRIRSVGLPGRLYDPAGHRSTWQAARFAGAAARLDLTAYDLVETANIPYAHLFPLAARRRRPPLVISWYELWGRYWWRYLGPLRAPPYALIERLACRLGDAVVASSRLTGDRLAARRRSAVPILPCGIDIDTLTSAAASPLPGPPIVYAGRLLPEKRVDLLLRAVATLPGGEPILQILGAGPDRNRLEALACDLGIRSRVDFVGFLPSPTDVWRRLAGAQVAVQPSFREGFGLFPLEAMALGLPVVHCPSPESSVGELVDSTTGLAADDDPASLAAAIGALLDNSSRRQSLGVAARQRAQAYAWPVIAARCEELFADVVARFRGRPATPEDGPRRSPL